MFVFGARSSVRAALSRVCACLSVLILCAAVPARADEPFLAACRAGHLEVAQKRLQQLHKDAGAARRGLVEYLKVQGLFVAAGQGRYNLVSWLLALQVATDDWVDGNQETPLFVAVRGGHVEVALLLLDHGASVIRRNRWKNTAADLAERLGYHELALRLAGELGPVVVQDTPYSALDLEEGLSDVSYEWDEETPSERTPQPLESVDSWQHQDGGASLELRALSFSPPAVSPVWGSPVDPAPECSLESGYELACEPDPGLFDREVVRLSENAPQPAPPEGQAVRAFQGLYSCPGAGCAGSEAGACGFTPRPDWLPLRPLPAAIK